MSRRVYWVPDEKWAAEERAHYAQYLATYDDDDGTLEIRVMGRCRLAREALRKWWRDTPLNVRMWRATRRMRKAWALSGIDPHDPDATSKMLARWHLQRGQR